MPTITSQPEITHYSKHSKVSYQQMCLASTFPTDYNYLSDKPAKKVYVMGMSVPPVMMAQVATEVRKQLFKT